MKKKKYLKKLICGLCGSFCLVMLYLHRSLIIAAIKGEELPKAPKGCQEYQKGREQKKEIAESSPCRI